MFLDPIRIRARIYGLLSDSRVGLHNLADTDFRLEMGQMAISLLQTFDGFPLLKFEWIHLQITVSMLPILCSTVSILLMVYSLHSFVTAV